VSELSDSKPASEHEAMDGQELHAPWTMLVTMCLLIAGFLFAGMLLVQQILAARSVEGTPIFSLPALVEKGRSLTTRPPVTEVSPEKDSGDAASSSPFEGLKQIVASRSSSDEIKWPRLKVTGFGKSADGSEKFAIINGDLVHPGEYADKVKLVEVRAHDVVVEYRGERRNLTMDLED
jgi:hypothetical protein